jgi:rhodanese-related sulfurtransferase
MTNSTEVKELSELLSTDESVTLLDVRRRIDYESDVRKIAGAAWNDPEKIETWAKRLPAEKRTVVYCVEGGSVSQSVADRLNKEGVDAVFLAGGIKSWIKNGLPVERDAVI